MDVRCNTIEIDHSIAKIFHYRILEGLSLVLHSNLIHSLLLKLPDLKLQTKSRQF